MVVNMGVQVIQYIQFAWYHDIILDVRVLPRERIIDEVMGRYYTEVTPIEKVSFTMVSSASFDIKS